MNTVTHVSKKNKVSNHKLKMTSMKTQIKIKVSEIKKGDVMQLGNTHYQAYSDSYLDNVWRFDISADNFPMTYGFTSNGNHNVTVTREISEQPLHTQREWKIEVEGRGKNTVYNIVDEKDDYVCDMQCKPDAQRIVKAVNFLSKFEEFSKIYKEENKMEHQEELCLDLTLLDSIDELLKQSE